MRHHFFQSVASFVCGALLCVLAGCSDGSDSSSASSLKSVFVSGDKTVTIGKSVMLTAKTTPELAGETTYTWNITDGTDFASFAQEAGVLTQTTTLPTAVLYGVSAGTAKVTVTVNGKTSAKYTVEVAAIDARLVLNTASMTMGFSVERTLYAFVTDDSLQVTWSSDNPDVATITAGQDNTATVRTTAKAGTATITASAGGLSAECAVTVKEAEEPETTIIWKPKDYTTVSMTDGVKMGILTLALDPDKYASISSTQLHLSNSTKACSVYFTLSKSARITVDASEPDQGITLENKTTGENTTKTTNPFVYDYENTTGTAETLYLYSKHNSVNIYSITIEYLTPDTTATPIVYPTSISLDKTSYQFDDTTVAATLTATVLPDEATDDYAAVTWASSHPNIVSVGDGRLVARSDGSATIYATTANGLVATCAVTVSGLTTTAIRPTDVPDGYAGEGFVPFYDADKVVSVSTREQLKEYAEKGGYTIYVTAMIDMTDTGTGTMLPTTNYDSAPAALDAFVAEQTAGAYATYAAWKDAYGAVAKTTDDGSSGNANSTYFSMLWKLNTAYSQIIRIVVAANTAIIGTTSDSGIKGGNLSISSSHVIIRNLTIQDACDPFTHHETTSSGSSDGFNAQFDNITVSGGNHVWIDHCTLEDTMQLAQAKNGEKWQVYDGLCDINSGAKNVTVSNCILRNHDKTMLIGSSATDLGSSVTIHHNRFINCGQRLPLLAFANMHIYNNSYERDAAAHYSQQACIAARGSNYTIIAENNYFGSNITKCMTSSDGSKGKCYQKGNVFVSGSCALTTQANKPFSVPYTYELDAASEIPTSIASVAGAGILTVK